MGMSARALSRAASLADGYVALVESGVRGMGAKSLAALADTLGVSADWLLSGLGRGPNRRSNGSR